MTAPDTAIPGPDEPGFLEALQNLGAGFLPGLLGVEISAAGRGHVDGRLVIRSEHLAPNGYLHAATIVALADTCCGYGARTALPPGASGFTTIELKSNFLGTLREGILSTQARLIHGGRSTQVWDATVQDASSEKVLALFRCTQAVLWPR